MPTDLERYNVERSFQDIPDDKLTEAEQTSFLRDLDWYTGSNWDDLLRSRRVLIISEAGAGKTYECRAAQKRLWEGGESAFYVELGPLERAGLRALFSKAEEVRFDAWLAAQSDVATFFLDSIDELKLTLGSFELALKRLEKEIGGHLTRVRVIITSRPTPIDAQLFRDILPIPEDDEAASGQGFADIAMGRDKRSDQEEKPPRDWRNVALLPLSDEHIEAMASREKVGDPDRLLAEIKQRHAEEFVRRPQDLIELCADWRMHHCIRAHRDQVDSNIAVKLRPSTERVEKAQLSEDKAREGARRLALASTLCRKLTLRHSIAADRHGDPDDAPLDPGTILHEWQPDERITLLERPLFGFASYGRVRFHHRSVIEYLAAEQLLTLRDRGMPIKAIKRLLFTQTAQGDTVVKPSMRPVAAWMAAKEDSVFEEIVAREPELLLTQGDPESLTLAMRRRALRAFVERHRDGGWRGIRVPAIQLHRFAAPDLGPEVSRLWAEGIDNFEIREILLNLVGLGKMTDCADLAFHVAMDLAACENERIDALDALVQIADPRLVAISTSLAADSDQWSNRLARASILRLFPGHLSVAHLRQILSRVTEGARAIGDLSWNLPRVIEHAGLPAHTLDAVRQSLTDLILEQITYDKQWPRLGTGRAFLLPSLALTCSLQLAAGQATVEILRSSIVAARLTDRHRASGDRCAHMVTLLQALPPETKRLALQIEDEFVQSLEPKEDPFGRYVHLMGYGATIQLGAVDRPFVLEWLADESRPADERAMVLEIAISLRDDNMAWPAFSNMLAPLVADLPALTSRVAALANVTPNPKVEDWERKAERRRKAEAAQEAKAHKNWVKFWHEIATNADAVFAPGRADNTAWNLWQAMERTGKEGRSSGWNRRFIERNFGEAVADRLRLALMPMWRNDRPTLRSERPDDAKNTYYTRWELGPAAIAAEAEDPDWAQKLSEEESQLALRYAPLEYSGFPSWLEPLAQAHPNALDGVLGAELTAELVETASGHSSILQNIRHASGAIAQRFLPRLCAWIEEGSWRVGHNEDEGARLHRLRQAIEVLRRHGNGAMKERLHAIARNELADGVTDALSGTWLPVLMAIDPPDGVVALEKTVAPHPIAQYGPAATWFGALFGDRTSDDGTSLSGPGFTPALLLKLARLSREHIRPQDDISHEGSYSPDARDNAQQARSNIIFALLETTGSDAWKTKLEFAEDPLFADLKQRILTVARERSANEADAIAYTEADILALDRFSELPPRNRDEMFQIMADRLDDLRELLLRDDSPRAAWALIKDETILRQSIARELRNAARGAYNVDQEAVTADGKETDIRLRSTGSLHEAIIELKVGEKGRSGSELRATLKDQLLLKYMAGENTRTGCLLITSAGPPFWKHPDTGAALDLRALIVMLNEEAAKIEEEMGGVVRLMVFGLDLRPRLPTEKAKSAAGKGKSKPPQAGSSIG